MMGENEFTQRNQRLRPLTSSLPHWCLLLLMMCVCGVCEAAKQLLPAVRGPIAAQVKFQRMNVAQCRSPSSGLMTADNQLLT